MPKNENCVFIKDISKCKKHFYASPLASKKTTCLPGKKKAQIKCALDAENCCALKKKKKNYTRCAKKNILILYLSTLLSLYLQFKKKKIKNQNK